MTIGTRNADNSNFIHYGHQLIPLINSDAGDKKVTFGGEVAFLGAQSGIKKEVIRQTDGTISWNDGDYALTVSQSGATILFDKDEATTVTLPAITAADIGITYTFVETVASNNARKIITKWDEDNFIGSIVLLPSAVWAAGTAQDDLDIFCTADTSQDNTILFDDNETNGAGAVGSKITLTAVVTGNTADGGGDKSVWLVSGYMGTADPNSSGAAVFSHT